MCLTWTPVAQRPTQAQRLVQLLRDIRMAGMVDEMENDFPTLFFEYISAAGLPDTECARMLLDIRARFERDGDQMLPRKIGWPGR